MKHFSFSNALYISLSLGCIFSPKAFNTLLFLSLHHICKQKKKKKEKKTTLACISVLQLNSFFLQTQKDFLTSIGVNGKVEHEVHPQCKGRFYEKKKKTRLRGV